jgi:hypothetical protein
MIPVQLHIIYPNENFNPSRPSGGGWGRCSMPSVPRVGEVISLSQNEGLCYFDVVQVSYQMTNNDDFDELQRNTPCGTQQPDSGFEIWNCDPSQSFFAVTVHLRPASIEEWEQFNTQRNEGQ